MGAVFIASKITEYPVKIKDIVRVFSELFDYRDGRPLRAFKYFEEVIII